LRCPLNIQRDRNAEDFNILSDELIKTKRDRVLKNGAGSSVERSVNDQIPDNDNWDAMFIHVRAYIAG
jgi:hypothetical protein